MKWWNKWTRENTGGLLLHNKIKDWKSPIADWFPLFAAETCWLLKWPSNRKQALVSVHFYFLRRIQIFSMNYMTINKCAVNLGNFQINGLCPKWLYFFFSSHSSLLFQRRSIEMYMCIGNLVFWNLSCFNLRDEDLMSVIVCCLTLAIFCNL